MHPMNGIEIGTAMGKREMLLYLQKACIAAGGTLTLKQINKYSAVAAVSEKVWAVEKYEGEIQGDIRRQSILISELSMHDWQPTDTEGHSWECSKCGEHISIHHRHIWDQMRQTLCSGKPIPADLPTAEDFKEECATCDNPYDVILSKGAEQHTEKHDDWYVYRPGGDSMNHTTITLDDLLPHVQDTDALSSPILMEGKEYKILGFRPRPTEEGKKILREQGVSLGDLFFLELPRTIDDLKWRAEKYKLDIDVSLKEE